MMKHYLCVLVITARFILFILKDHHICKTVEQQVQEMERTK